jgi:hypothetical protein
MKCVAGQGEVWGRQIHRQVAVVLRCIRFKAGLMDSSCVCRTGGENPHALGCSEVTWCVYKLLAAVCQPLDTYIRAKLFVTPNTEEGPLSWIRNLIIEI